jgi:phenylacetate-coenzyme A ligase PaaK-like adenylate-forming protein
MLEEYSNCVIYTFASSAVRVCIAAQEAGLNIKGTRFLVTGEPLTPQKKKEIEAMGARAVPIYGISEAGVIAAGCAQQYPDSDTCHFLIDTNAVISHRLKPSYSDAEVDSFLFTSLLFESPKILLNVGMGDYGTVWKEPCSCEFGTLGFDAHVSRIHSYEKLTGEGDTFVDTDLIHIIEDELPRRFGGQSTDYQLIEEEDARGLTRLRLLISPRLDKVDEQALAEMFIQLLKAGESSPESSTKTIVKLPKGTVAAIQAAVAVELHMQAAYLFDNVADQNAYQVDPLHLAFLEQFASKWRKVVVYDAE